MEVKNKSIKIFVAGHRGMVGSAIVSELKKGGYNNIITRVRSELDLRDHLAVMKFFSEERPQWVFLAAAKVGGIYANNTYPVEFLLENLKIQNNILEASYQYKVEKLLFLGSSCIYPKFAPQPLREEYLLSSKLEETNEAYAIAKIAGIKLCKAYNQQYHTDFMSVMPCNLYGLNDNYHPQNSHVLPALIRRFHEAKESGAAEVIVWGTGSPRREFMFSGDLANATLFLMENYHAVEIGEMINIGTGEDCTISELVEMVKEVVGFKGNVKYDSAYPDGTPKKLLDVSKINSLGWKTKTSISEGLKISYQDFLTNHR